MSSKAKQGPGPSNSAQFQQGLRSLKKGDFKQALKDARVCFRQTPTPECRSLLEQASYGRALELDQSGLKPQALDVIQELLAQPIADDTVRQQLPELLLRLGILDRYPQFRQQLDADPQRKLELALRAADHAVLRLGADQSVAPEIRHGAALVVAAFDKLDAGQEADALELLKDISRQSPFADWRLFARGAMAHYRQDAETAEANWSRLNPDRVPSRLAGLLKTIRKPDFEVIQQNPQLANTVAALEAALWKAPLLTDIRHLKARCAANEWVKAVNILRHLRDRLKAVDPAALTEITLYFRNQAIVNSNPELLKELTFSVEPLAWDPHWNQAWALLHERDPDSYTNLEAKHWSKYVYDLEQIPTWNSDEIRLAQSIVYAKLGDIYKRFVSRPKDQVPDLPVVSVSPDDLLAYQDTDWDSEMDRPPIEFFESQARDAFDQSLRLWPALLDTQLARVDLWRRARRNDEETLALQVLLTYFPDHVPSLERLAKFFESDGRGEAAIQLITQLRKLKPLDEKYLDRFLEVCFNMVRDALAEGDLNQARRILKQSEEVKPGHPVRLILRSLTELKAGDHIAHERSLNEALTNAPHQLPIWFTLATEASLGEASAVHQHEFTQRYQKLMQDEFDPAAAGEMARYCRGLCNRARNSTKILGSILAFSKSLAKHPDAVYELDDLRAVCDLLILLKTEKRLTERLLMSGRGKFKSSGFFSYQLGVMQFNLGPDEADADYVEKMLTDARTKILQSKDPAEAQFLIDIEMKLGDVKDYLEDDEYFDDDEDDEDLWLEDHEFSIMLRKEMDRQLSKYVKPGMNVSRATRKDFNKIMRPGIVEEMIQNLSKESGLDLKTTRELFNRFCQFEES